MGHERRLSNYDYTYQRLSREYDQQEKMTNLPEAYTFDDVIIVPRHSIVNSRSEVSTTSYLTPNIRLEVPVISANMDKVTETNMAIAMAEYGGIGAIHRGLTIQEQAQMVADVKAQQGYILGDPPVLSGNETLGAAHRLMEEHNRQYVTIIDPANQLHGFITLEDARSANANEALLANWLEAVNNRNAMLSFPNETLQSALERMWEANVRHTVLVDSEGNFGGVITDRDIYNLVNNPRATIDNKGRLQVLAAIGIGEDASERAYALQSAGVDGIIIDVLHGNCNNALRLTRWGKKHLHVPIITGNIATKEDAEDVFEAGADVSKTGYGPGSFCTTRIVSGNGSPQLTAAYQTADEAYKWYRTVIVDGGIRYGGDFTKAIAAGGAAIMVGGLIIGTDESPGEIIEDENGNKFKIGRGNATHEAAEQLAKASNKELTKRAPQGVGNVKKPYKGSVKDVMFNLEDGLRSGIANSGGKDIDSFQRAVRFQRQTPAAVVEGTPHGSG